MTRSMDQYGAALLRAALRSLFPKARCGEAVVTDRGFTVALIEAPPFQEGYLQMLQKEIVKLQNAPFQVMEMAGGNAEEMLSYHGQPPSKPLSGTLFIAQIGKFYEPCQIEPSEAQEVILLRFEQWGEEISIWGKAFEGQLARQQFMRLYRKWVDHRALAAKLELYEGSCTHPRGVLWKRHLGHIYQEFSLSWGFIPVETPDPKHFAQENQLNKVLCEATHYAYGEQACISSLHMVESWARTFAFEGRWFLRGKTPSKGFLQLLKRSSISCEVDPSPGPTQLEMRVIDSLGCYRRISTLSPVRGGLRMSLVENFDEWMGLLLEKQRGQLPPWLLPEQVRLLIDPEVKAYLQVTKKLAGAKMRFTIDRGEAPLKEKMYRALRVNVPCVMVFGKYEEKTDQMTIRAPRSTKSTTISLTQLDQCIAELSFES